MYRVDRLLLGECDTALRDYTVGRPKTVTSQGTLQRCKIHSAAVGFRYRLNNSLSSTTDGVRTLKG